VRCCFFSPGYLSLQTLAGDTQVWGGAEAQVANLAASFAQFGHEVSLVYGDGGWQAPRQLVGGVTCIDAAPSWRRPASLAAFWRALNDLGPDLIYARLPSDFLWMLGLFTRRRTRSRFVYALASDLHCIPWKAYDHKRWFHAPMYALGLRTVDLLAIQHENQSRLVRPHLRGRVRRIPNVVRSISASPRPYADTKLDAIWVGEIRKEKQVERFLDLAAGLPGLCFAVVGEVSVGGALRALLETRLLGLKNLTYFGPQNHDRVMALIARSRVLVNTSPAEGFPNTMLEAWSLGVPVVSLSVDPGGIITRERLGFVSRTEARLRHDVSVLARTEPLNVEFGSRGLAYVRGAHSLEAVCEALMRALAGTELVSAAPQSACLG
jgi:glycosyltransferase involved in cell wall biosynthesis